MSSTSSQSKSRREQGGGISLFPFLAVLICTMGALLVLLVVLSHQANERRRLAAQNQTSANADTQNSQNISADTVTGSTKDAKMGKTPTDSVGADSVSKSQSDAESQSGAREATRRKNLQLRAQYAASRQRLTQLEAELEQLNEQIAQNEKFYDFSDDLSTLNAPQPSLSSEDIQSLQIELEQRRTALETMRSASLQTLHTQQQADEQLRQQLLETESERQRLLGQIEQQKSLLTQTQTQLATILAEKQATEAKRNASSKRGTLGNVENIASSAETITEGKPVYSIVPYAGANGVRRRPIYLECRRDGIFLQPEGVRFDVSDFANLESKNQPLTIALELAESAILKSQTTANPSTVERPYVLLLVRPNGIAAYYAARAALDGHEGDYGYEMIGADWEMTYPEADPQLRQAITLAVDAARAELRKQQMLATLAASNTPTSLADTSILLAQNRSTAPVQSGSYPTTGTDGMSGIDGPNGMGLTTGNEYSGSGTEGVNGGGNGPNGTDFATETGTAMGGMAKSFRDGMPSNGTGTEQMVFADGGFDQLVFGDSSQGNSSGAGDLAMDDESYNEEPFGLRGSRGATDRSGVQVATRSGTNADASSVSGSTSGSADSSLDSSASGASSSESSSFFSLASTRGKNWGLPDAVSTMSPVSRPIRAVCTADRITLPRNSQTRKVPEIVLNESTSRAMDDLVSAVWDHMKTWGFAGRQMYWKPVLNIEVLPGAESRFQEIASLLAGSGIEIRRVEASPSVQTSQPPSSNASMSSAASSASSTPLTR